MKMKDNWLKFTKSQDSYSCSIIAILVQCSKQSSVYAANGDSSVQMLKKKDFNKSVRLLGSVYSFLCAFNDTIPLCLLYT